MEGAWGDAPPEQAPPWAGGCRHRLQADRVSQARQCLLADDGHVLAGHIERGRLLQGIPGLGSVAGHAPQAQSGGLAEQRPVIILLGELVGRLHAGRELTLLHRVGNRGAHDPDHEQGRRHPQADRQRLVPTRPALDPLSQGRRPGADGPIRQKALQVVGQDLGAGITVPRRLGHRLEDDRLQVDGDAGHEPAWRRRLILGNLPQQGASIGARERRRQREQFVERQTKRINVGAVIDQHRFAQGLLGAHVAERADHVAGGRQVGPHLGAGQAEIRDPEVAGRVEQEVARLDVSMHDSLRVSVCSKARAAWSPQPGHPAEVLPGWAAREQCRSLASERMSFVSGWSAAKFPSGGFVLAE